MPRGGQQAEGQSCWLLSDLSAPSTCSPLPTTISAKDACVLGISSRDPSQEHLWSCVSPGAELREVKGEACGGRELT